jgi:hypothetical protein
MNPATPGDTDDDIEMMCDNDLLHGLRARLPNLEVKTEADADEHMDLQLVPADLQPGDGADSCTDGGLSTGDEGSH